MTRWIIRVKGKPADLGVAFARDFVGRYDTSKLDWIRIDLGRTMWSLGCYGRCHYPKKGAKTRTTKKYRISCQVPGPYPTKIRVRLKPLYKGKDENWLEVPEGCECHGFGMAKNKDGSETHWHSLIRRTEVKDQAEGIAWIIGHEMFHFLRKTKQVPGTNIESQADAFGNKVLDEFRTWRLHRMHAAAEETKFPTSGEHDGMHLLAGERDDTVTDG